MRNNDVMTLSDVIFWRRLQNGGKEEDKENQTGKKERWSL